MNQKAAQSEAEVLYQQLRMRHYLGYPAMGLGILLLAYAILWCYPEWDQHGGIPPGQTTNIFLGFVLLMFAIWQCDGNRSGINTFADWKKITGSLKNFPLTPDQATGQEQFASNMLRSVMMDALIAATDLERLAGMLAKARATEGSILGPKNLRYRVVAIGEHAQDRMSRAKFLYKLFSRLGVLDQPFSYYMEEAKRLIAPANDFWEAHT